MCKINKLDLNINTFVPESHKHNRNRQSKIKTTPTGVQRIVKIEYKPLVSPHYVSKPARQTQYIENSRTVQTAQVKPKLRTVRSQRNFRIIQSKSPNR